MQFNFSEAKNGIVFGAGRGIGLGLVKALLSNTDVEICAVVRDLSRSEDLVELSKNNPNRILIKTVESYDEEHLKSLYEEYGELDFIINSIGFLHTDAIKPERKIEDCTLDNMLEAFKVNSIISIAIAKTFMPAFKKKSPTLFSTVSAKVGSIDDNGMGGWYSYRASKSALNMFLKNIAIEFNRRAAHTSVVAIHPGTTITELSAPFTKKTSYKLHTIDETGHNIINVLDGTECGEKAQFLSWDGATIAW